MSHPTQNVEHIVSWFDLDLPFQNDLINGEHPLKRSHVKMIQIGGVDQTVFAGHITSHNTKLPGKVEVRIVTCHCTYTDKRTIYSYASKMSRM